MKIIYNRDAREWWVEDENLVKPLRDVYIEARKAAGKSVGGLEREMGLNGRNLYYLEHGNHVTGKPNVTLGLLVRALQHLGYELDLSERTTPSA